MPRRLPTVRELAAEAGIDTDSAILTLLDSGHDLTSPKQTVPCHDLRQARSALGLPLVPERRDPYLVTDLALRAALSESEVRKRLIEARILRKRRLKRVPPRLLAKAETILELRKKAAGASRTAETAALSKHPGITDLPVEKRSRRRREEPEWPTIGPAQELVFLTPGDIVDIHWVLVKDFAKSKDPIDPPGVRSEALLESAAHRPKTALGLTDKYPTVAMAGAALLHSIVLDHSFHNGNKRTALVAMLTFLDKNGWVLTCDQDEIYEFLLRLADHQLSDREGETIVGADRETIQVATWLQGHTRRVARREHPLAFRQLRAILESYDCILEPRVGNRINIRRDHLQTHVAYRNEGTDVEKNTIHKIRSDLELDDRHGYDSDIFYNRGPRIPEFINKYRKLLERLAKV